jgi:signal peptidase I
MVEQGLAPGRCGAIENKLGKVEIEMRNDFELVPIVEDEVKGRSPFSLVALWLRELVQVVVPALVLALVVHLFLAQATVVYGQSMEPNLSQFQRLIIDKLSYRLHAPQRNDIVVIDLPAMEDMLVKRIVGLPGETLYFHDQRVYVNGEPLAETFPHDPNLQEMGPRLLGPQEYFVMGDNRSNSNDSRSFGPIPVEDIVGRVWLRYWPLNQFKYF